MCHHSDILTAVKLTSSLVPARASIPGTAGSSKGSDEGFPNPSRQINKHYINLLKALVRTSLSVFTSYVESKRQPFDKHMFEMNDCWMNKYVFFIGHFLSLKVWKWAKYLKLLWQLVYSWGNAQMFRHPFSLSLLSPTIPALTSEFPDPFHFYLHPEKKLNLE